MNESNLLLAATFMTIIFLDGAVWNNNLLTRKNKLLFILSMSFLVSTLGLYLWVSSK